MKEPKSEFLCFDGPFKGEKIAVGLDGRTAVFTVGGLTGFYHNGRWVRKAPPKEAVKLPPLQVGMEVRSRKTKVRATVVSVSPCLVWVFGQEGRISVTAEDFDHFYERLP